MQELRNDFIPESDGFFGNKGRHKSPGFFMQQGMVTNSKLNPHQL